MASRRFFDYDPYEYYYTTSPYHFPYPYYHRHQQPATSSNVGGFFPAAEPAAVRPRPAAKVTAANPAPRAKTVSIPVQFVGSDPEPEPVAAKKRAPSAEDAAVRVQAAARGFLARKAVRALRAVEREAKEVAARVAREAEALRGDARARVAVGEELMRLLLRLDAVRGAREFRRRVAKRVLALQDAVDALEPRPAPAAVAEEPEPESEVTEATADEMAEESEVAPDAAEHSGGETEAKAPAVADADMEVEGDRAAGEPCAADEHETEHAPDGASRGADDMSHNADIDGEWEMVPEEPEPAAEAEEAAAAPPRQEEPAGEVRKTDEAGGGVDATKVMEMVAALCERSAQQCAVIGALAERVEALERAVRQVEDAERRRRRAKKLRKEGKGSNRDKCYVD